jgi:DNA repair exonuclease SbcCD ATPase subunit
MDDKYDDFFVTFILTKTDQVNIHEVIDSLNLDESVLRDQVDEETQLREDLEDAQEELQKLKQEHSKTQRSLKKLAKEEKQIRSLTEESPSTGQKRTFDETSMSQSKPAPRPLSEHGSTRLEELAQERQQLKMSQKEGVKADSNLRARIAKTNNKLDCLMASMRTICIDERNK